MFNTKLFAEKIEKLTPYEPNKAPCRVRLDANESFFKMDSAVLSQMTEALADVDFNRYPDPDATELCTAFAELYGLSPKNVIAANGSDELLSIIANSLLGTGDTILTLKPDFSMYGFYGELAQLKVEAFEKACDFKVDFSLLDTKIKQLGARLVIFSNPCNPTGILESKEKISKLINGNPQTIFVIDEAYLDFACMRDFGCLLSDEYSFLHDISEYPNMFVIKTMSKAFGAAAIRIGFAVGDTVVSDAFRKVKSPYNVNSVSQVFGKIILAHADIIEKNTRSIVENTDALKQEICKRGFTPFESNTNFIFAKCNYANELFEYLCQNGIFIRKFNFDGGYLRITAGSEEENATLLEYIDRFLEESK